MSSQTQPWDQQKNESPKAWAAFILYRDMGPRERTLEKVESKLREQNGTATPPQPGGKKRRPSGGLTAWQSRHRWVERAKAWDQEQDRIGCEARIAEIREMNKRQAKAGLLAQSRAIDKLNKMKPDEIEKLTVGEVVALLREGARLERIARGEPAEIVQQENKTEHTFDLKKPLANVPTEKLAVLQETIAELFADSDSGASWATTPTLTRN
jgi:hypothetical protein